MVCFGETEPELFGKPNATQWFELSRDDVKAQTAFVPVPMENNANTASMSLAGDDAPSSRRRAHPRLRIVREPVAPLIRHQRKAREQHPALPSGEGLQDFFA